MPLAPLLRFIKVTDTDWHGSLLLIQTEPKTLSIASSQSDFRTELTPTPLFHYKQNTFWIYHLQIPLTNEQQKITYSFPALSEKQWDFYVVAKGEAKWHLLFHSCNGYSSSVTPEERQKLGGVDCLWRNVLKTHAERPYHVMIGGGDQLYCDGVWQLPSLQEWLIVKGTMERKMNPWTEEREVEVQEFYFDIYRKHFEENEKMGESFGRIPQLNMLDDHDIFDGTGSYPEYLEK